MPVDRKFFERRTKQWTGQRDDALRRAEDHERERAECLKYAESKQKQIDELKAEAEKVGFSG